MCFVRTVQSRLAAAAVAGLLALAGGCDRDDDEPAPSAATGDETTSVEGGDGDGAGAEGAAGDEDGEGAAAPPAPDGPAGAIEGRVVLEGDAPERIPLRMGSDPFCDREEVLTETVVTGEDGGLRDVFVRVGGDDADLEGPVPDQPVVIDQEACMYRPRVQGAVAGQTLRVKNSDATLHNVHGRYLSQGGEPGQSLYNRAQPEGAPPIEEPIEAGGDVVELGCDMHRWMRAFVVISDHAYFDTSGQRGAFRIENVPVGTYEVEAWHEHYGVKEAEVEVEEDAAAEVEIVYDAEGDAPE